MGYEVKLHIGWLEHEEKEIKRSSTYKIDEDANPPYIWFPSEKDAKGDLVYTGRTSSHFFPSAMVDLCKIGDGPLYKLMLKNRVKEKNPQLVVKWYSGPNEVDADAYGDRFIPVVLPDVIKALEKEIENDNYHRFQWALDLCKSVMAQSGGHVLVVLFEGH